MGTPLASSHRLRFYGYINLPIIKVSLLEQKKSESEESKTSEKKRKKVVQERRDSTISFRVSRSQRECIEDLAKKCGMSLSDYVLSRAYGYEPKQRLTEKETLILDGLMLNRSDYVRYASMLNNMSQEQRRSLFRDNAWMRGALEKLAEAAEMIQTLISRHFAPNRVPKTKEPDTGTTDKTDE